MDWIAMGYGLYLNDCISSAGCTTHRQGNVTRTLMKEIEVTLLRAKNAKEKLLAKYKSTSSRKKLREELFFEYT